MSETPPSQPASRAPGQNGSAGHAHAVEAAANARRPRTRRFGPKGWLLIALGVLVFLLISAVLARWLSVENLERDEDLRVIQAEARGDPAGMVALLHGCRERPACVARIRQIDANPRVRRPGSVKILDLESQTSYALGAKTGPSRVAWTVIGTLPVIQCVQVKRTGNFLTGINVQLLAIGPPIQNEADC